MSPHDKAFELTKELIRARGALLAGTDTNVAGVSQFAQEFLTAEVAAEDFKTILKSIQQG